MKRNLFIAGICVAILFFSLFLAGRIMCGIGIRERIHIAKKHYPGKAEDALIAYLADNDNSLQKRTDVAIWTLGQIRSEKALPILYGLYKNDPLGMTCKGHHNTVLCQYEIHKAIVSTEHGWLGAKEKNWFGSWSWLNK
jgi:hypothetical protein